MRIQGPARTAAIRKNPRLADNVDEDRLIVWDRRLRPALSRWEHEAARAAVWALTCARRQGVFERALEWVTPSPPIDWELAWFVALVTLDTPASGERHRDLWSALADAHLVDSQRPTVRVPDSGTDRPEPELVWLTCPGCGARSLLTVGDHEVLIVPSAAGEPPCCGRGPCRIPVREFEVVHRGQRPCG